MNQRVLITACAAGIGLEIAKAFAATGVDVFVCGINAEALNVYLYFKRINLRQ